MPDKRKSAIPGGCPCNFWSSYNCWYVQAVGVCKAPPEVRPNIPDPRDTEQSDGRSPSRDHDQLEGLR